MKVARALVAVATYPVLLAGSVLLAHLALEHGAPAALVAPTAFVAVLLVTMALERAHPFEPRARPTRRELSKDGLYLAIAAALNPVAKVAGTSAGALATIAAPSFATAWPGSVWPRVLAALLLADVAKYAVHRLSHERPWWWRFHAEHHAPEWVYSLNGVRFHPVNLMWNLGLDAVPVALFGLDVRSAALVAVFRGTVAVLQHANVDLALGPLRWVLSTPDLHRWHHSASLAESNGNYGGTFIIWDRLFGTYVKPARRAPSAYGLAEGTRHPDGLVHALVWPWCSSPGRSRWCRAPRA